MRIGYLGAGAWGVCLASLLAKKGHDVVLWTIDPEAARVLTETRELPSLAGYKLDPKVTITLDLATALDKVELIVEGVTSAGMRPVFKMVKEIAVPTCPIVLTSKGIEQGTCMLLSEVVVDVLGNDCRHQVGCLSGPSLAEEVMKGHPTSVVCSSYRLDIKRIIKDAFSTPFLRVYPNDDMNGVQFGGAMKNIIALGCGISDGLGFGDNTKAALMTRGLHEIRKLGAVKGCRPETLFGLAGMGDLCVTCMSTMSRNYRFGRLIGEGVSPEEAQAKVGGVVEGAYTCVSALQLGKKEGKKEDEIELPISEAVYSILYEKKDPLEAVQCLLRRVAKEERQ